METIQLTTSQVDKGVRKPTGPDDEPSSSSYRWIILFLVWLSFLMSCVDRAAWSTVAAPVGISLGIQVAMLGSFVTAFYAGYVFTNVFGSVITDAIGGRGMLILSMIPLGIATFLFSFAHNLSTGILIQFLMGLAAGADMAAGVKLIASWFNKERGRALGIYSTGTSLSVMLANATVPTLYEASSWQTVFRILGFITLFVGIVCGLLVRSGPLKNDSTKITRSELISVLSNRNLIYLGIGGFGALWALVGFSSWSNALMTKAHGISPVTAGSIIATFGLTGAIGKPLLGWICDLFREFTKYISLACLICFSVALILFGHCSTLTQFYVLAPILGVVAFGTTPLFLTQVTWTAGEKYTGAAVGLTNAMQQCGSTLAPILVGHVYAVSHSFSMAFLTLALGPVLGFIAQVFVARDSRILMTTQK